MLWWGAIQEASLCWPGWECSGDHAVSAVWGDLDRGWDLGHGPPLHRAAVGGFPRAI